MLITISKRTKENIIQIYKYIAKNSIKYANETVNNIYSLINYLEHSPYLGRYVPEVKDKRLREVLYKSYRIVYTVSEKTNTVYIHFVLHGKRDFTSYYNSYISKNDIQDFL